MLVFHTSGVTHRNLELPQIFLSNFQFKIIEDFAYSNGKSGNNGSVPNDDSLRSRLIAFLEYIGVLARLNTENEFSMLCPWIMEVRGHYTEINLSLDEVKWVSSMLGLQDKVEGVQNNFSIHFRLGDLLNLTVKTHISVERLLTAAEAIHYEGVINVYSDSAPQEVEDLLKVGQEHRRFAFHLIPTIEVIEKCVGSRYFIGTNSKISLWISILRIFHGKQNSTWLPIESSRQIGILMGAIFHALELETY